MDKIFLFLLVLIICNAILITLFPKNNQVEFFDNYNDEIEIVLARYEENIDWINEYPFNRFKVTVYNKGSDLRESVCQNSQCQFIKLPNVGRCDHTYLHHIVQNYSNLPNVTLFLPASCMDEHKKNTTLTIMKLVVDSKNTVLYGNLMKKPIQELFKDFKLDEWKATNKQNANANPESALKPCEERPYRVWYEKNLDTNIEVKFVCFWGIFAVARKHIIQNPKSFYEKLVRYVDNHSNPEAGHYIERSWGAIFYPYESTCLYEKHG